MPDLSICTCYPPNAASLKAFLTQVYLGEDPVSVEVIVVDPTGEIGAECATVFPRAVILQDSTIKGFIPAYNRALAMAGGRYLALISPEARPEPDCFLNTLSFLDENAEVGLAAPRQLHPKDAEARVTAQRLSHTTQVNERPQEIAWASGGVHILRREMYEEIGGFDPAMGERFALRELYLRARAHGWHNVMFPQGVGRQKEPSLFTGSSPKNNCGPLNIYHGGRFFLRRVLWLLGLKTWVDAG